MDKAERNKLKTLLTYWIEHSREHGMEFKEWADKMGGSAEAEELLRAVRSMDEAVESLQRALKIIGKEA